MLLVATLLGAVVLGQSPSGPRPVSQTGAIRGRVLTADAKLPVRGAVVAGSRSSGDPTALTDGDGRFELANLTVGRFTLEVTKVGFLPAIAVGVDASMPSVSINRPGDPSRDEVVIVIQPAVVISGVVTDASGLPASHARVTATADAAVTPVPRTSPRTVETDAGGRFAIGSLQSGAYRISAADPASGLVSDAVVTAAGAGEHVAGVGLVLHGRLPHAGGPCSISGRVLDEYQEPLQGFVTPVPRVLIGGAPSLAERKAVPIDPEGRYCLAELVPDDYTVMAQVPWPTAIHIVGDHHSVVYPPTFYPGVSDSSSAAVITVDGTEPKPGLDIVVKPQPVARVTVRVGGLVRPTYPAVVSLETTDRSVASVRTLSGQGGVYALDSVAAGHYVITALVRELEREGEQATQFWGAAELSTDGFTPVDRTIALEPAGRVSGRVLFEGPTPHPQSFLVWLTPIDTASSALLAFSQTGSMQFDDTGGFTINGIQPGRYVLHAADQKPMDSPRWSLARATEDGRDILDLPIDVVPGGEASDLVLTFTDRLAALSGSVTSLSGGPEPAVTIIAFAADERYWSPDSRRVRQVRIDADGRYLIPDLPPGDYLVGVVTREQVRDVRADFPKLTPFAVPVTTEAGATTVLNLRTQR